MYRPPLCLRLLLQDVKIYLTVNQQERHRAALVIQMQDVVLQPVGAFIERAVALVARHRADTVPKPERAVLPQLQDQDIPAVLRNRVIISGEPLFRPAVFVKGRLQTVVLIL